MHGHLLILRDCNHSQCTGICWYWETVIIHNARAFVGTERLQSYTMHGYLLVLRDCNHSQCTGICWYWETVIIHNARAFVGTERLQSFTMHGYLLVLRDCNHSQCTDRITRKLHYYCFGIMNKQILDHVCKPKKKPKSRRDRVRLVRAVKNFEQATWLNQCLLHFKAN